MSSLPSLRNSTLQNLGFGPGYTALDALTLYMMVRDLKPKRYMEIGAGLSTYYCSLAAEKNTKEGYPVAITCIEPNPYDKLHTIPGIRVISKEAQDVDISTFQELPEHKESRNHETCRIAAFRRPE